MKGRVVAVVVCAAAAFALQNAVGATGVLAAWSATGTGRAAGAATTMPTGAQPSGGATGSSVTIRWPTATFANGGAVAGYVINRFDAATGAAATVGAGCSGVVTTTTCTELSVPPGTWIYTDTPVQLSWTGGQSPGSAPIVVPLT
jgi:hypothetical protein